MPFHETRVYLDVSALGRPYDDQNQLRVHLETDAVQLILASVARGEIELARSTMHWREISANPDQQMRDQILAVLTEFGTFLGEQGIAPILRRLQGLGIQNADALHSAIAISNGFDFVSCDDRLLRKLEGQDLGVWCGNPVRFCEREELR